jgi:hypothetical protein
MSPYLAALKIKAAAPERSIPPFGCLMKFDF